MVAAVTGVISLEEDEDPLKTDVSWGARKLKLGRLGHGTAREGNRHGVPGKVNQRFSFRAHHACECYDPPKMISLPFKS